MAKIKNAFSKGTKKIIGSIGDAWYSVYRRLPSVKSSAKQQKIKDRIFFWGVAAIPLLMLAFSMAFINFNSIIMAFQTYDGMGNATGFAGFENFAKVCKDFVYDADMLSALSHSLVIYITAVVVQTIIPIFFSYYLYKKNFGTGLFKVILYLPSIISSMTSVIIFKGLSDQAIPSLFPGIFAQFGYPDGGMGFLSIKETSFPTVLIYYLWMSLGGGMLVFLGAMNSVDKSVMEASHLDGVGYLGELWHVVLPKSYTVISVGFIVGIVSIFTNEFGLYAFYGENAGSDVHTLGYRFLVDVNRANSGTGGGSPADLPYWAAWGLFASIICIPLTFLARYVIYKFGPSED